MPNLPHSFEQLRVGPRVPFLIAGAGLSWGLVPLPGALLRERKAPAEEYLGCGAIPVDYSSETALYDWAEKALAELPEDSVPKLRLAEALGLLTDTRWTAGLDIPLRGTTPRHRVIARLVRERRWVSIWSLNWDTHLENALERIGFRRGGKARPGQPWQTQYQSIITREDFSWLGNTQYFCILKPHGCVEALTKAKACLNSGDLAKAKSLANRFMITAAELGAARDNPTDTQFFAELKTAIGRSPLVVLGWSVSEPYLIGVINETMVALLNLGQLEELTVIDPWFNDKGHTKAAGYYNLRREQVHAELETRAGGLDADAFFLWMQARYALDCLQQHALGAGLDAVTNAAAALATPVTSHYLLSFADDFLPAWIRLCWRASLVQCAGYEAHELRLEERDLHVPWNLPPLLRPDLKAAAGILGLMRTTGWDLSLFPGAACHVEKGRLVVPIPAWGNMDDLAALKPLVSSIRENLGYVQSLEILPVDENGDVLPLAPGTQDLRERLAAAMPVMQFADPSKIGIASELRES